MWLGWVEVVAGPVVPHGGADVGGGRSAPPSPLSLLGLVRHLTEMERLYAVWALGPKAELRFVWGDYTDDGPQWDDNGHADLIRERIDGQTGE